MSELTIRAKPHGIFTDDDFRASIQGLAIDISDPAPFAISYEVSLTEGDIVCHPDVCLWRRQDDKVAPHRLGRKDPALARDFAVQAFSFLSWSDLRIVAEDLLRGLISHGHGEEFHLMLCPHGALLIATRWRTIRDDYGLRSVAGALVPPQLSAHERVETGGALAAHTKAAILEQNRIWPSHDRVPDIFVTFP